jgi:hypothetical protein
MCSVLGAQWMKSHAPSRRSSPSTRSRHSPERTKEVLLRLLAVVKAVRLTKQQSDQPDPELVELGLATFEQAVGAERMGGPGRIADVHH